MLKRANHLRLAALPAAIMMAGSTYAQQSAEEPVQIEEVVVVGIRASVQKSIDDKRNAQNIVDTINAEDIGKSTDQNIAEALNRVSGVSINTEDGEGTTIAIRGANADQTVVTLNGTSLGSTGFSQGVDLSSYSADVLSKIEVIKTPSADHEEGSLGGLVNLQTRKPLDIDENVRTFGVQGRYNDLSEEADYKLSGTFSQKFLDDSFGVLVTVTNERNTVRRDQYQADRYGVFGSSVYSDTEGNAYGNAAAIEAERRASGDLDQPEGSRRPRANEFEDLITVPTLDGSVDNPYAQIVRGIAPKTVSYALQNNERERSGIDLTLQWEANENTSLSFNSSYNVQDIFNTSDIAFIEFDATDFPGHIDGVDHPRLGLVPADFRDRSIAYEDNPLELGGGPDSYTRRWTDPQQDWRVLDFSTRTWTQFQNRHTIGSVQASENKFKNENSLFAFELDHQFQNDLSMKVGLSTRSAKQTPDRNIFLSASRSETIGVWNLHHVPADIIQPAGYDCTSGTCVLRGGTSQPFLGDNIDFVPEGRADLWDNIGSTGFNPDDLASHTLNFIQSTVTKVKDDQSSAFVDFDWEVDAGGLTSIEFGGKYTNLEKLVDDQQGLPAPSDERVEGISPLTGDVIVIDPSAIKFISAALFDDGEVSAPGFLDGLGVPEDHITDGWRSFDPVEAINLVSDGERDFTIDRTRTRTAEFENIAVYLKANFSLLDDRLFGNVGVRYVSTEVDTTGFSGAVFGSTTDNGGDIINPILLKRLRDTDKSNLCTPLSGTPAPVPGLVSTIPQNQWNLPIGEDSEFYIRDENGVGGDVNDPASYAVATFQDRNRWARIDGLGYDTKGTLNNFADDTPIAAVNAGTVNEGVCYDPLLEEGALPATFRERYLVRYSDVSTDQRYVYNRQVENGNLVSEDRSRVGIASSSSHDYEVVLPSLNMSFAASDDFIVRFAASKTMARPPIDELRAGFSLTEGNLFNGTTDFRTDSRLELFTAEIDPLESMNLDLSLEWYFDDDALLGVNFFTKDIKNLIEVSDSRYFLGDLTRIAADPENSSLDDGNIVTPDGESVPLLLLESSLEDQDPNIDQCFARRLFGENNLSSATDVTYGSDPRLLCNEFNVSRRVNADKASVEGVELQYSQNFTSLPGFLSGLGTSLNYTYQKGTFNESKFPIPGTPRESYNATIYWAEGGHQVRLAYSGASDSLVRRSFQGGAEWREGRDTLDLSADFALTDNLSVQFNAQNLTDEPVRTYFTSRSLRLPNLHTGVVEDFDEGSAIDGDAPDSRTLIEYNTGVIYRLGLRATF